MADIQINVGGGGSSGVSKAIGIDVGRGVEVVTPQLPKLVLGTEG